MFQELIAPRCFLSAESACACSAAITAAAFVFGSVVLIGEALGCPSDRRAQGSGRSRWATSQGGLGDVSNGGRVDVVWSVGPMNEGEPPAPTGFAELMDGLFDGLIDPQRRLLIEHDDRGHGTPSLAPQ